MCDWAGTQTIRRLHTNNEANNTDKQSKYIFNSFRTTLPFWYLPADQLYKFSKERKKQRKKERQKKRKKGIKKDRKKERNKEKQRKKEGNNKRNKGRKKEIKREKKEE